jgi:hypothetical protein
MAITLSGSDHKTAIVSAILSVRNEGYLFVEFPGQFADRSVKTPVFLFFLADFRFLGFASDAFLLLDSRVILADDRGCVRILPKRVSLPRAAFYERFQYGDFVSVLR